MSASSRLPKAPKLYPVAEINGDTDVLYDILIDSKEKENTEKKHHRFRSALIKFCDENKITYRVMNLPVGDYIINRGKGIVVEMKDIPDFCNSFSNSMDVGGNHLDMQLKKLVDYDILPESIDRYFVIRGALEVKYNVEMVEKVIKKATKTKPEEIGLKPEYTLKYKTLKRRDGKIVETWAPIGVHLNSFIGYIEKVERHATYVPTGDYTHTCDWFRVKLNGLHKYEKEIWKKQQLGDDYVAPQASMRSSKITLSDSEKILNILEGFPNVGPKYADSAMTKFRTLRDFFEHATEKDLKDCGWNEPVRLEFIRLMGAIYSRIDTR